MHSFSGRIPRGLPRSFVLFWKLPERRSWFRPWRVSCNLPVLSSFYALVSLSSWLVLEVLWAVPWGQSFLVPISNKKIDMVGNVRCFMRRKWSCSTWLHFHLFKQLTERVFVSLFNLYLYLLMDWITYLCVEGSTIIWLFSCYLLWGCIVFEAKWKIMNFEARDWMQYVTKKKSIVCNFGSIWILCRWQIWHVAGNSC